MNPVAVRSLYARMMADGEPVILRRYDGTGSNRSHRDAIARAQVMDYQPQELIGDVRQGDMKLIVLYQDLLDQQFPVPITIKDRVIVRGRELAIIASDDNTRRIGLDFFAYELQARGGGG